MGEGWGEGIPQIAAIFPNTLTAPIQALRLVALSLALSHGREDGVAVGIKGSARKTGCAGCFLFFRRPEINSCKSKLPFKSPKSQNALQPTPSPVGEGWGEGILQIAAIFPNTVTAPIQALRFVALSLALSHGREDGVAVGVKVCYKENRLCRLLFAFQTTFINVQFSQLAPYNFQKSNQNQLSATVQAAFPILATCAGFPPVHRLFAAKFRGSKNAAR